MNEEITVEQLVKLIGELIGVEFNIISDQQRIRPIKSEVQRLICNNDKIKMMSDWKPDYNLKSGLLETIAWFKQNIEKYKPEIYNR